MASTIINTCHGAGTDPLAYLTDIIAKLHADGIAEFLSDRWYAARSTKAT